MALFHQTAEGEFTMWAVAGYPHCGMAPGKITFKYELDLAYQESALTEQGFLLDNTFFSQYFADLTCCRLRISCEHLAQFIARDFLRLSQADSVRFNIQGIKGVWIKYELERGS